MSPTLAISRSGNVTTLNWPAAAIGFVPETATNLASPVWLAVTNQPVSSANAASVTNVTSDPARFFRLRQSLMVDNLMEPFAGLYGPISTNASGFLIAQEFALPAGSNSYHLDKVTLPLSSDGGENGTISVSVWNVAADGSPTNEIATVASQLVGQTANVDFVPTNFITLAAGTSYYIVTAPQSVADNGLIYWAYTQSTNAIGLGALGSSADTSAGSVWSVYPIDAGLYPQQMSVQASPVSP